MTPLFHTYFPLSSRRPFDGKYIASFSLGHVLHRVPVTAVRGSIDVGESVLTSWLQLRTKAPPVHAFVHCCMNDGERFGNGGKGRGECFVLNIVHVPHIKTQISTRNALGSVTYTVVYFRRQSSPLSSATQYAVCSQQFEHMAAEMKEAVTDKVRWGGGYLAEPEPLSNLDITVYSLLCLRKRELYNRVS